MIYKNWEIKLRKRKDCWNAYSYEIPLYNNPYDWRWSISKIDYGMSAREALENAKQRIDK